MIERRARLFDQAEEPAVDVAVGFFGERIPAAAGRRIGRPREQVAEEQPDRGQRGGDRRRR